MKIIFLDIDGVLNSEETVKRRIRSDKGFIGIDPYLVAIFNRIIFAIDAKIVLSSSWRILPDSQQEVRDRVMDFIDMTKHPFQKENGEWSVRGDEIQEWLSRHPEVTKYAILDDDTDGMRQHGDNYFRTYWEEGLTEEIAKKVVDHLNK